MISLEEKRAAYEEARQLLLLEKKWQSLMPGERKPDFKRAAKAVIRRALGKQVVPREPDLDIHDGLMHEHAPREARLLERTLRNGIVHPDVLTRSGTARCPCRGRSPSGRCELKRAGDPYIGDLAPMVHAVHFNEDLEFPTHLNTRTQEFVAKHADHEHMHYMIPGAAPTSVPMRDRVRHI